MKICAIICEYNPFHNGHAYQIEAARTKTHADFVVCIMSGQFVQRGEAAILDKYERARHAVFGGADAVVELPVAFATSPAELFAKGGVKLAHDLGAQFLSFGAETDDEQRFLRAARLLTNEPPEISEKIKADLARGNSYARARQSAWQEQIDDELLTSPNNILAIEYTKAVCENAYLLQIVPVLRKGVGHDERTTSGEFSSAKSIRENLQGGKMGSVSAFLPSFVFDDLPTTSEDGLQTAEKIALLLRTTEEIRKVCDCSEGLENALKKQAATGTEDVAAALTSKRYTTARLRRIMLQNLLTIDEAFIREALCAPLYGKILAVDKRAEPLLSYWGSRDCPLLLRAGDEKKLSNTAKACLELDERAESVYAVVKKEKKTKKNIFIER